MTNKYYLVSTSNIKNTKENSIIVQSPLSPFDNANLTSLGDMYNKYIRVYCYVNKTCGPCDSPYRLSVRKLSIDSMIDFHDKDGIKIISLDTILKWKSEYKIKADL